MSNYTNGFTGEKIATDKHLKLAEMAKTLGVEPHVLLGWAIDMFEESELYSRVADAMEEIHELEKRYPGLSLNFMR